MVNQGRQRNHGIWREKIRGCVGSTCPPIDLYLLLSDPTVAHLCLRLKRGADPTE